MDSESDEKGKELGNEDEEDDDELPLGPLDEVLAAADDPF